LYFDKINEAGGVDGHPIKFIVYDNQNEGKNIVENAIRLFEKDKAVALFEFYGSIATKILVPILDKNDMLMLAPVSGQSYRNQVVRNIYSVRPGFEIESETMIDFLINTRGIKKIGIFNAKDGPSELGSVGRAASYLAMKKAGLEFAGLESRPRDDMNMASVVDAFIKADAKAILIWARDPQALELIKASHAKGFKPVFVASSTSGTNGFIESVSKLAQGQVEIYLTQTMPTFEATHLKLVRDFLAEAKAAKWPQSQLNSGELEGYFNAIFMTEVLRRAAQDYTTAHLREVLDKMNDVDIAGIKIGFSPSSHSGVKSAFLTQVKAGKLQSAK
jgi:branched-chain amino acid transport system substrate-binding protein